MDSEPSEPGGIDSGARLSLNTRLELLTHHHRRELLRVLIDDPDHTATVAELVRHLLARDADRAGERPEPDELERVLHHRHLPKLTAVGVVEYDSRSQAVRYWPHERVEALLDFLADEPVA